MTIHFSKGRIFIGALSLLLGAHAHANVDTLIDKNQQPIAAPQALLCDINFTSPAANSVLRSASTRITGTGSAHAIVGDQGSATAILNGTTFFSRSGSFTALMQFLGSGAASINLREGSNQLAVKGSVGACSASDQMRLFYIKPDDVCYAPVELLEKVKIPENSTTKGFYINQICIAKYSCGSRVQMENIDWLTKVVPAFVKPLLDKTGKWKEVIKSCGPQGEDFPSYIDQKICENSMANYHIEEDLQKSLDDNGCGTDKDWDTVGSIINECISEKNGVLPSFLAKFIISRTRNKARKSCLAARTERNIDLVINGDS